MKLFFLSFFSFFFFLSFFTRGGCASCLRACLGARFNSVVLLNVLGCRLTYQGQAETSAEAWFNIALRPRKPEGSLGRTAQDGHLDSHTVPELWGARLMMMMK